MEEPEKDIAELIFLEEGTIKHLIFKNQEEAESYLTNFKADLRFDLHGVLDTVDHNKEILPQNIRIKKSICVISYVGRFGKIRDHAKEDITKRILSKQIDFGVLIFNRGKGQNRCSFHDIGSKAWMNSILAKNSEALFIDDGFDHIESTKSMGIAGLRTLLFKRNGDLVQTVSDNCAQFVTEQSVDF